MGCARSLAASTAAVALLAGWPLGATAARVLRGNSSLEAAGPGSEGAPLRVDDVAFGVLSCSKYLESRHRAQVRTWLGGVKHFLVSTDADNEAANASAGFGTSLFVDKAPFEKNERLPNTGAPRALALVGALHDRFPQAKWYFFVDDDTYVYVPNLIDAVLGQRDPMEPHYIGWACPVGPELEGVLPGQWMPRVAIGGAGFAISRGLMARLAPEVQRCRREYSWNWQGDVRIAQCVADLGFGVEDDPHLYPESVDAELRYNHSHLADGAGVPPASFHHLSPQEIDRLHAARVVRSASGALRADFGRLALREVALREPGANRTFRVRFGWRVDVEGTGGRRAMAADRLTAFVAGPPGVFRQEYRGSACGAGEDGSRELPARPLTVSVEIRCGACGAGPLAVEAVREVGACSFELRACAECPPWERA